MSSLSSGAQWASRRVITTLIVHLLAVLVAFGTILVIARLSPISAATGEGVPALLDAVLAHLPERSTVERQRGEEWSPL